MSRVVAHRVIARRCSNSVAFGAKRTWASLLQNRIYEFTAYSVGDFRASCAAKNAWLEQAAAALVAETPVLLEANARDVAASEGALTAAQIDRLRLTPARIRAAADGLRQVAALPDPFREVIVLREINDLSYRDIAEVIGAPVGTVMSRLARARSILRTAWLAEG